VKEALPSQSPLNPSSWAAVGAIGQASESKRCRRTTKR
jgi:hypothetical protein